MMASFAASPTTERSLRARRTTRGVSYAETSDSESELPAAPPSRKRRALSKRGKAAKNGASHDRAGTSESSTTLADIDTMHGHNVYYGAMCGNDEDLDNVVCNGEPSFVVNGLVNALLQTGGVAPLDEAAFRTEDIDVNVHDLGRAQRPFIAHKVQNDQPVTIPGIEALANRLVEGGIASDGGILMEEHAMRLLSTWCSVGCSTALRAVRYAAVVFVSALIRELCMACVHLEQVWHAHRDAAERGGSRRKKASEAVVQRAFDNLTATHDVIVEVSSCLAGRELDAWSPIRAHYAGAVHAWISVYPKLLLDDEDALRTIAALITRLVLDDATDVRIRASKTVQSICALLLDHPASYVLPLDLFDSARYENVIFGGRAPAVVRANVVSVLHLLYRHDQLHAHQVLRLCHALANDGSDRVRSAFIPFLAQVIDQTDSSRDLTALVSLFAQLLNPEQLDSASSTNNDTDLDSSKPFVKNSTLILDYFSLEPGTKIPAVPLESWKPYTETLWQMGGPVVWTCGGLVLHRASCAPQLLDWSALAQSLLNDKSQHSPTLASMFAASAALALLSLADPEPNPDPIVAESILDTTLDILDHASHVRTDVVPLISTIHLVCQVAPTAITDAARLWNTFVSLCVSQAKIEALVALARLVPLLKQTLSESLLETEFDSLHRRITDPLSDVLLQSPVPLSQTSPLRDTLSRSLFLGSTRASPFLMCEAASLLVALIKDQRFPRYDRVLALNFAVQMLSTTDAETDEAPDRTSLLGFVHELPDIASAFQVPGNDAPTSYPEASPDDIPIIHAHMHMFHATHILLLHSPEFSDHDLSTDLTWRLTDILTALIDVASKEDNLSLVNKLANLLILNVLEGKVPMANAVSVLAAAENPTFRPLSVYISKRLAEGVREPENPASVAFDAASLASRVAQMWAHSDSLTQAAALAAADTALVPLLAVLPEGAYAHFFAEAFFFARQVLRPDPSEPLPEAARTLFTLLTRMLLPGRDLVPVIETWEANLIQAATDDSSWEPLHAFAARLAEAVPAHGADGVDAAAGTGTGEVNAGEVDAEPILPDNGEPIFPDNMNPILPDNADPMSPDTTNPILPELDHLPELELPELAREAPFLNLDHATKEPLVSPSPFNHFGDISLFDSSALFHPRDDL